MGNVREGRNDDAFRQEIKQIVSNISRIDVVELDDRLLIREELGIDSLMAMEIIATCEKFMKLKIDETLFADIQTVGDYLDLLVALRNGRHA